MWSQVKGHVADNNTTYKMDDVKELFKQGLAKVTTENWTNYDRHVQRIEDDMWEKEETIDKIHQNFMPIIIQPFEDIDNDVDMDDFNDEDNDINDENKENDNGEE